MTGAVFDTITKSLIGIIEIDLDTQKISQMINDFRISVSSDLTILRFDKIGTVVASSRMKSTSRLLKVTQLDIGVDDAAYLALRHYFLTFSQTDQYDKVKLHRTLFQKGVYISASLVPSPPEAMTQRSDLNS
jgi:hypothetical protein